MWYLGGIILLGIGLRVFHGLITNYHVLGADSYWFHWLAGQDIDGHPVDWLHSGLAWPLAQLGKVIGLEAAGFIIPLAIYVAMTLMIYWLASRMFDRAAGLCAALCWTILRHAIYITSPQFLDRDGFTLFIITAAACMVYWVFTPEKISKLAIIELGILMCFFGQVMYEEWAYAGRWMLLGIIGMMLMVIAWKHDRRAWLSLVTMIVVAIPFIIDFDLNDFHRAYMPNMLEGINTYQKQVGELGPMEIRTWFLQYYIVLPFVPLGFWMMVRNTDVPSKILVYWFAGAFIASFWASRMLIIGMPAAVIVAGYAVAVISQEFMELFMKKSMKKSTKKYRTKYSTESGRLSLRMTRGLLFLIIGMVLTMSIQGAYLISSKHTERIDPPYERALAYIKENTPEDAVVMTWWNRGLWVLDVGDRWPLRAGCWTGDYPILMSMDTSGRLIDKEIAEVYTARDPADVLGGMAGLGATLLIFSENEEEGWDDIAGIAGYTQGSRNDAWDLSLLRRIRDGEIPDPEGLRTIYREPGEGGILVLEVI